MKMFSTVAQEAARASVVDDADSDCSSSSSEVPEDEANCSSFENQTQMSDVSTQDKIAAAESRAVSRSKIFVYIILCLLAAGSAAGTWYFVQLDEIGEFEHEFGVLADEMIEGADDKATTVFRQLHTLSTSITSHALDEGATWPFVTLPHYHERTKELGDLSGSNLIIFAPLVDFDVQENWEDWVRTNQSEIFRDTFGAANAPAMAPVHDIQLVPEDVVQSTNLTVLHEEFLLPALQYGPDASSSALINFDLNSHPVIQRALRDAILVDHTVLSEVTKLTFLLGFTNTETDETIPRSVIVEPVYDRFDVESRRFVGVVLAVEAWTAYFEGTLPAEVHGFVIDVHDTCDSDMTFVIDFEEVVFRGHADLHDTKYDYLGRTAEFAEFARYDGEVDGLRHCDYSLRIYPSNEFESDYHSEKPYVYAAVLVAVFAATISIFALYDFFVQRRQKKVQVAAERTTQMIHSLFPKAVGDRLIAEAQDKDQRKPKGRFDMFNTDDESEDGDAPAFDTEPIADFFTNTTIMFADIVGFTAWSSTREPKQVFSLLETIYRDFDAIAHRRGVFKVETVGDCYVAVAGLPQPRHDHAVVMARFARDCMFRFQALSHQLEVTLGPDTADLAIRVGLHSGPVTAGVLRGERARFQLFGDTMNTASRMESTSKAHKIQISQETADLLSHSEKEHWYQKREDLVAAKGKGMMQTYWLDSRMGGPKSSTSESSQQNVSESAETHESKAVDNAALELKDSQHDSAFDDGLRRKEARLVKWNVEILTKILVQVVERRRTAGSKADSEDSMFRLEQSVLQSQGGMVLDEVKDLIRLPPYNPKDRDVSRRHSIRTELSEAVKDQLQDYVQTIAAMYRENPFHNFEHASHVTMSVVKLLSRIVAPDIKTDDLDVEQTLHDHTYGITSDPMTQFACALSALIHDVDHTGVPNTQLVKEKTATAIAYQNKSVAEQNSVDLAWSLLMEDEYTDLRRAIYSTGAEFKRFRSLVVNSVLATDIMDKDLGTKRKQRWAKAFSEGALEEDSSDVVNRKATIVLEHLIQASDVAHTMQHWQVYQKWNERLFSELFRAYKDGRSEKDPSEFWYKGEIGFLEYYIIPLAKKLKDCGVFGVSSDEYLNYALRNRREWTARGHQIVEEFKEKALAAYADEEGASETKPDVVAPETAEHRTTTV